MSTWKQLWWIAGVTGIVGLGVFVFAPDMLEGFLPQATTENSAQGSAKDTAAKDGKSGPARVVLVVLGAVAKATINDRVSALGTGIAAQSTTLLPFASVRLTEVRFPSGAVVSAGDIVAMIDASTQQVACDFARITRDDALTTLARNQRLGSSDVIRPSILQGVKLAADRAELALKQAQIDLANRQIVTPIGGVLGIIAVSVGDEVTPSAVIRKPVRNGLGDRRRSGFCGPVHHVSDARHLFAVGGPDQAAGT